MSKAASFAGFAFRPETYRFRDAAKPSQFKPFGRSRSILVYSGGEAAMKRRALQIFLIVLGILFIALIYPLYTDLWHAKWLVEMHNETEPMFLSFFITLGPFLLLAARNPPAHRTLILFTAWWNLSHAAVMTVETVQSWNRGVHRDFTDVVIVAVIGLILLVLLPERLDGSATLPADRAI